MADITIKVVEESGGFDNAPQAVPPSATPNQATGQTPQASPVSSQPPQSAAPSTGPGSEPVSSSAAGSPQRSIASQLFERLRQTNIGQRIEGSRAVRRIRTGMRSARRFGRRMARSPMVRGIARRVAGSRIGRAVAGSRLGAGIGGLLARIGIGGAGAAGAGAVGAGAAGTGAAAGAGAVGAAAAGTGAAAGVAAVGAAAIGGPVVVGVVAGLAAAGAGLKAFDSIVRQAADQLERFSGDVQMARAMQNARTQINLMERARVTGPALGRIEDARGRLNDAMERVWTRILSILIKLEPFFTKMIDGITVIVEMFNVLVAKIDDLAASFTFWNADDDKAAEKALNAAVDKFAASVNTLWNIQPQKNKMEGNVDREFNEFLRLYGVGATAAARGGG